jgi:hypothetical protein
MKSNYNTSEEKENQQDIINSSANDIVNQIKQAKSYTPLSPFALLFTILLACWLLFLGTTPSILAGILLGLGGIFGTWLLYQMDTEKSTVRLFYEIDDNAKDKFASICSCCAGLGSAAKLWLIETQTENREWKRHAGASSLISRRLATITRSSPFRIKTNIQQCCLSAGDSSLLFLPDQILLWHGGRYVSIDYDQLRLTFSLTRFIEDEPVPSDAKIVGTTWRHPNINGGPDKRFRNNHQIPVVEYGEIAMKIPFEGGRKATAGSDVLILTLNASDPAKAEAFVARMMHLSSQTCRADRCSQNKDVSDPFVVLGIHSAATQDEIRNAYHHIAKMYHPDRVAHLGPEFRELAECRMREINRAYEYLKRDCEKESSSPAASGQESSDKWIRFTCANCGRSLKVSSSNAGRIAKCSKCSARNRVPRN